MEGAAGLNLLGDARTVRPGPSAGSLSPCLSVALFQNRCDLAETWLGYFRSFLSPFPSLGCTSCPELSLIAAAAVS